MRERIEVRLVDLLESFVENVPLDRKQVIEDSFEAS